MKVRTYVRIAKGARGPKVEASAKSYTHEPLKDSRGNALATVAFAVEFEIDDAAFRRAAQLLATVKIDNPEPLVTVTEVIE